MAFRVSLREIPADVRHWNEYFRTAQVVVEPGGVDTDAVENGAVTDAKLRDSAAVSVIGRAANSTGDPADIAASANDRVLARTGDALSFAQLTVGMAPDALWTYAKIQNVSATDRLLGRSTALAGVIEEIVCTAAGRALLDDAAASDQRTTLGLGTAAVKNTGASGDAVPLLNAANTWSLAQTFSAPPVVPSYTVAGVPSASPAAQIAYISNEAGGAVLAFSDGTNWRRVTDRAVIS